MIINEEDYIEHYGTPRHSGRYPWGSGGNEDPDYIPRTSSLLDEIDIMKKKGLTQKEMADALGLKSTTEFRNMRSAALNERRQADMQMVRRLKDKQMSNTAISARTGIPEATIRSWLTESAQVKVDVLNNTVDHLKKKVDELGLVDVGSGNETYLNISSGKLRTALSVLKEQGYSVETVAVAQLGTGKDTRTKVLAPPGTTWGEIMKRRGEIKTLENFDVNDPEKTALGIHPPLAIDSKRVQVKYGDEGGADADGVIYVRPNVKDISIGNARYAQVRVQVGDGHYLKGMAVYKNDIPDGVDLVFNTNKKDTGNKLDAMKKLTDDKDNPFGSMINHQLTETDGNGKTRVTSAMNIVNKEGDWQDWDQNIASQVLSKQSPNLAKNQLDRTYNERKREFDEIMSLTNPVVRQKLLKEFSDSADSASVHLKAAAIPRQGWHVILPVNSLPPNQIYAPKFRDGETVALIRYPHGGTFEIPELVVNNRHPGAKRLLGVNPVDAVGIHSSVAERLSGADFDGDTVLVIPNNNRRITSTRALEGLEGFNAKVQYPKYEGMKVMRNTQTEMGNISNLITDMTIKGASRDELTRAVRHSMVVIDAEKHELNYKQSAIDNNIRALKEKYQLTPEGGKGAATLISRAKSEVYVPQRKPRSFAKGGPVDPVTGRLMYEPTGKINYRSGLPSQTVSTKLAEATDAHSLSSGSRIEGIYADHSNRLKDLANTARKEMIKTPMPKQSASAKKVYAAQVQRLDSALQLAIRNQPRERQAQILANSIYRLKLQDNPAMDPSMKKKIKYQALEQARARVGAKKPVIEISPDEWEAIQAGAVSASKLRAILDNANMETVKTLATPRTQTLMTSTRTQQAQAMLAAGYTRAEVADRLGVSLSTLGRSITSDSEGSSNTEGAVTN